MSMSKKDFIALADALRPFVNPHSGAIHSDAISQETPLLDRLVDFCRDRNPRFDAARWLSYLRGECGPNGGKRK